MQIVHLAATLQQLSRQWHAEGRRVGLVPTMGYLHEGHGALIDLARQHADRVIVTIFVNPTQFGPNEDFERYPRDFERDRRLCEAHGADCIFAPSANEFYAPGSSTWVTEELLSQPLCGRSRPGHFRGVTTVCAKLFLAAMADVAVFGQKDAQQVLVIQRMVRDLNFPLEIVVAPIKREPDGLAMSSRNVYLSPAERQAALAIHRGLTRAEAAFLAGERQMAALLALVRSEIAASGGRIDYVEGLDTARLEPVATIGSPALLAVAAWYGKTRLIDNRILGA